MTSWRALGSILVLFVTERPAALLGGAALAVLTALAGIGLLGLSGWFVTATALAGLSTATALSFDVFAPGAAIRLLAFTRTSARYGERLSTHAATLAVLAGLRERLFRAWAEPDAARRLLARPARLLFRLTADIDALDSAYLRLLVPAGTALAATLLASVTLGLIRPILGLALAAFLLATGFGLPWLGARLATAPARRRAHAIEALRARTIDLVAGQTDLCLAGRLPAQIAALAAADSRLAAAEDRLNAIETGTAAAFGLAAAVMLGAILAAMAVLATQHRVTAPMAAFAVLVAFAALEPFSALRRGALELGRLLLAARRLAPRLLATPKLAPPALPPAPLALRLVSAGYCPAEAVCPILSDITLHMRRGERIAVIGASGAGKSTLLGLASGELAPSTGSIQALPATLLTQRTELFQDSLRDNLRLAAPAADDAQLWAALAAAGLDLDAGSLPGGLDARLGEGGIGLSGGQARRLALARLLLRDAPLWLLDEPTEGLDGSIARDVLARLSARAQGRTLLIATHIRREAEGADRLLLLNEGRLAASLDRGTAAYAAALARLRPD